MSDLLKKCYKETVKSIWSEHSRVMEEMKSKISLWPHWKLWNKNLPKNHLT